MNVLASCLIVYVPVATLAMLLVWIFLVKGPLEFTTTLYWVAASAIATSLILGPLFAQEAFQPLRMQRGGIRRNRIRDPQSATLDAQNVGRQPTAAAWPVEWIANRCPEFRNALGKIDVVSCRVTQHGAFATFQGDRYYYALYCVQEKGVTDWGSCRDADSDMRRLYSDANVAVFVQHGGVGTVRLVLSQLGLGGHFGAPRIGENTQGAIMELPYVSAPTCTCNGSTYYLWRARTRSWQEMDWESWKKELRRRLPSNLSTWNDGEFWPDLGTLAAASALWREEDKCHACASGGTVTVQLGIVDNRFVLKSLTIHPEQK